jgi:hypothetical protein
MLNSKPNFATVSPPKPKQKHSSKPQLQLNTTSKPSKLAQLIAHLLLLSQHQLSNKKLLANTDSR